MNTHTLTHGRRQELISRLKQILARQSLLFDLAFLLVREGIWNCWRNRKYRWLTSPAPWYCVGVYVGGMTATLLLTKDVIIPRINLISHPPRVPLVLSPFKRNPHWGQNAMGKWMQWTVVVLEVGRADRLKTLLFLITVQLDKMEIAIHLIAGLHNS